MISVVGLHVDAAGNDHENLNEEWIELRNTGTASIDLTNWGIKDESASHRYGFPSGFLLGAGQRCGSTRDAGRHLSALSTGATTEQSGTTTATRSSCSIPPGTS